MFGKDQRVIRRTPHAGHGIGRFDEEVGANRHRWDTGCLEMNTIVHTARTARPSTSNRHYGIVTRPRHLLDDVRRCGFRGRGLAMVLDLSHPKALTQEGNDLL
jgi:hypothetical protein